MKTFATTLIATLLLASFVAPESAYARRDKPRKKHATHQKYSRNADGYGPGTQFQYDINKLPFGSQLWWQQMERMYGGGGAGGGGR
jgi:hypothetical protein